MSTTLILAVALMGQTAATDDTAAGRTRDGRIAYVSKADCLKGHGVLALSDTAGNGTQWQVEWFAKGKTPASRAAVVLCKHFNPGL